MPQMGSVSGGILQPECRQEKYGMIEKSTVHKPCKAVCSCYEEKKSTIKAKYRYDLHPNQHCHSVVISVCHDSASVSSFSVAVTCFGPGIPDSCPYHQFRQCRGQWGGETLGQMCMPMLGKHNVTDFSNDMTTNEIMKCEVRKFILSGDNVSE